MVWKMVFLFQGCLVRFHVNLPRCSVLRAFGYWFRKSLKDQHEAWNMNLELTWKESLTWAYSNTNEWWGSKGGKDKVKVEVEAADEGANVPLETVGMCIISISYLTINLLKTCPSVGFSQFLLCFFAPPLTIRFRSHGLTESHRSYPRCGCQEGGFVAIAPLPRVRLDERIQFFWLVSPKNIMWWTSMKSLNI